jgi:hypothetical protein
MLAEIRHLSALLPSLHYNALKQISYDRHIFSCAILDKLLPSPAQIWTKTKPSSFFIPKQVKFNTNRSVTLRQTTVPRNPSFYESHNRTAVVPEDLL